MGAVQEFNVDEDMSQTIAHLESSQKLCVPEVAFEEQVKDIESSDGRTTDAISVTSFISSDDGSTLGNPEAYFGKNIVSVDSQRMQPSEPHECASSGVSIGLQTNIDDI